MINNYDVVIIGGGCAGLNIASLLGKHKLKVCLLDSKKNLLDLSFFTLGSFLEPSDFQLSSKVIASKISEVIISSSHFHIKKYGHAYILDKYQLHKELLEKCYQHKVVIKTSTIINSFVKDNTGKVKEIVDQKGQKYFGKIFIDCSGINGVFSKELGLQDKQMNFALGLEYNVRYFGSSTQVHLLWGKLYRGGYGWIFPTGNGRAILGFGSFNPCVKKELKQRLDSLFEIPFLKKLIAKDNNQIYGGILPKTDVKTKLVSQNVLCLGDCVSQANPLVGEGYRFIMEAGVIAAPWIYKSLQTGNLQLLNEYENTWKKNFAKNYYKAKKVQQLADKCGKSDLLTDLLILFLKYKSDASFVKFLSGNFISQDNKDY